MRNIFTYSLLAGLIIGMCACDGKELKTESKHDSALERYIDEPREKAHDVKHAVEDQADQTKDELNKILE